MFDDFQGTVFMRVSDDVVGEGRERVKFVGVPQVFLECSTYRELRTKQYFVRLLVQST